VSPCAPPRPPPGTAPPASGTLWLAARGSRAGFALSEVHAALNRNSPLDPPFSLSFCPSLSQERDGTTRGEYTGKSGGRAGFEGKMIDHGKKLKG
jgi:hypothetical protein